MANEEIYTNYFTHLHFFDREPVCCSQSNTFESEVEEIHSRFLGPTLKCGFDIPIWRLFLSLEGGGSLLHELTDFYDDGWRLFPTAAMGIKYRF